MVALSKNIEQLWAGNKNSMAVPGSRAQKQKIAEKRETKKKKTNDNEVKWVQLIIDLGIVEIPFQL